MNTKAETVGKGMLMLGVFSAGTFVGSVLTQKLNDEVIRNLEEDYRKRLDVCWSFRTRSDWTHRSPVAKSDSSSCS